MTTPDPLALDSQPPADAPREVQRVWRLKLEYNNLSDKLKIALQQKNEEKVSRIRAHMQQVYGQLLATEHLAKAKVAVTPGVNIQLPEKKFTLKVPAPTRN